jgi:hypothetical protein
MLLARPKLIHAQACIVARVYTRKRVYRKNNVPLQVQVGTRSLKEPTKSASPFRCRMARRIARSLYQAEVRLKAVSLQGRVHSLSSARAGANCSQSWSFVPILQHLSICILNATAGLSRTPSATH